MVLRGGGGGDGGGGGLCVVGLGIRSNFSETQVVDLQPHSYHKTPGSRLKKDNV